MKIKHSRLPMKAMIRQLRCLLPCIPVMFWTAFCVASSGADAPPWPQASGAPVARHVAVAPDIHVLTNPGFVVGFDRERGRAAWVAYRVTPVADFSYMRRPQFRPDRRVNHAASRQVYWGPKFDRGHLAPNYAMAQLYGRDAQRAAFYFSNITPQTPRLNQLAWQRLEEIEIDDMAPRLDELWVTVGPIYASKDSKVPVAFYRIWQDRTPSGQWRFMAFRVPQDVRGDERLSRFLVSVDAIEQATGLDFFSGLADAVEASLEAEVANAKRWGFATYACMPARYRDDWQNHGGVHLDFDRCD